MPPAENRFFILTLGCPKNEVDSDVLASSLLQAGWKRRMDPRDADVVVVNTCSFIAPAVEESVESILELADLRGEGPRRLVVAGCLVARYGAAALLPLLPEVDACVGFEDYHRFPAVAASLLGGGEASAQGAARSVSSTLARGFVYLKIADGCRRRCAYCAIPSIRGPLRSRPLGDITAEASRFLERGARELVLVAQDTTSYGLDLYGEPRLHALIEELSDLDGDFTIRVMYMHPEGIDARLLESLRRSRALPYLDIPLQHADPDVLAAMGRSGGPDSYRRLFARIEDALGEVALRSTFIVGYPGEGRRSFRMLYDLVAEARFDWLGLFSYSQEEGTPAFSLGSGCPGAEKRRRLEELWGLQDEIMRDKALATVGRTLRVLVEGRSLEAPGFWEARSFREAPDVDGVIFLPDEEGLAPGTLREVEITKSEGIDLLGTVKAR